MSKARSGQNKKTIPKNAHYPSMFDDGIANYYGIPAILLNKTKTLIYSPFCQKFALLPSILLDKQETVQNLRKKGFFAPISFRLDKLKKERKINLALTVTTACNQHCKYCFTNAEFLGLARLNFEKRIMEPRIAASIIKNLSLYFKIRRVDFIGGEPTTNIAAIKSVIFALKSIKQPPSLLIRTNGIMSDETLEYLIKEKFAFSVSWDGLKSSNLLFRGCDSKKVEKTILKLAKYKAHFRVRMTLGNWNITNIFSSIKWLISNGVKFIHLEPLQPVGRGKILVSEALSPKEFINIFFSVYTLAERSKVYILNNALANLFFPKDYFCPTAMSEGFIFNPDGSISGCDRVQRKTDLFASHFIIGKYKRNTKDSFNPARFRKLEFRASKYLPCKNCPFLYICSGGCPLNHLEFNPENTSFIRHIDPSVCDLRKGLITKAILLMYNYALRKKPHFLNGWEVF